MSKFWGLAALVVGGLIIGDLILHASGTKTVLGGVTNYQSVAGNQLLGSPAKGG